MKKLILLSVLAIVVASCGYEIRKKPEPPKPKLTKEQANKERLKDYNVVFLFEYDGIKVYRFQEYWGGDYVYFTNANGTTYYKYIRQQKKYKNKYQYKYQYITRKVQSLNTKK